MHPHPFISQREAPDDLLQDLSELVQYDANLYKRIGPSLRQPMVHLLRQVNSYYSNKIEGNPTLPADVLRAQQEVADGDASEDILEIKRHIDAQVRLSNDPIDPIALCSRASISRMHREFYTGMPDDQLELKYESGEVVRLVPGEFRDREVKVGNHLAPTVEAMKSHMNWFENSYRLDRIHGLSAFLAAAASHHRLMWIHPFLDGNGRTGRLFTDQYLRAAGLGGYGLWSISRGFGRDSDAYYAALKAADRVRTSEYDGKGQLSGGGLLIWTRYFINTALDQVKYFSGMLQPSMLDVRMMNYFTLRSKHAWVSADGAPMPLMKPEAYTIYKILLDEGPKERVELMSRVEMKEFGFRALIHQMSNEGLISAEPRKPVSLRFSPHAVETFFPHLFTGA